MFVVFFYNADYTVTDDHKHIKTSQKQRENIRLCHVINMSGNCDGKNLRIIIKKKKIGKIARVLLFSFLFTAMRCALYVCMFIFDIVDRW